MSEIDVNRGVVSRLHRETGVRVYMYYDKPGYYYDEHTNAVADNFAEAAGFPVAEHAKERYKQEKLADFTTEINRRMAEAEDAADKEVLEQKGEYKILKMAYGTAIVVDGEGHKITPMPIPLPQAKGLLDALVPSEPEVVKKGKK